jgi:fluoride exporter
MITAVAFVVAAGVGALARTEAGRRWNRHQGLAWGTLIVNVVGSFGLGLLHGVGPPTITIIGVGGLGAFTTFSSFARDAVALAEARQVALCFAYITISCSAGIGAAALGMAVNP